MALMLGYLTQIPFQDAVFNGCTIIVHWHDCIHLLYQTGLGPWGWRMSQVSNSLWMLRSSLMNLLGLWPPDCFWPGVVVAFGKWVGVAGVPCAAGAARRFPVIIWGATADPELNWLEIQKKMAQNQPNNNLCNSWNITLRQNKIGTPVNALQMCKNHWFEEASKQTP